MKHILVIVDPFTKFVTIYATADQKTSTLAPKIADFITRFGVPETILTDKGKSFQAYLIEEIYNLLDMRKAKLPSTIRNATVKANIHTGPLKK